MHEFVVSAEHLKREYGVRALDVAKRLIDFGFHPPTVYFPMLVQEALMIEPTETETLETLDRFANAVLEIVREAGDDAQLVHGAPYTAPVRRLDEARAVRTPILRCAGPLAPDSTLQAPGVGRSSRDDSTVSV
jgi:glycine dehydrogenase subunit 2